MAKTRALKPGYYRFVAVLTWPPEGDVEAKERLKKYFIRVAEAQSGGGQEPVDLTSTESYNLIGERTFLIIGPTNSAAALQEFVSSIVFKSLIQAKVSHAVEGHELLTLLPKD